MKREGFFAERVFPVLFMALITAVSIAVIAGIYLFTEERVSLNETLFLKRAVLYAAGLPTPDDPVALDELYGEHAKDKSSGAGSYIELYDGSLAGYAVIVNGPGLWGEIQAVIAYEPDLATMRGIEFVKQSETPGLGGRISETWFKEQFRGKKGPFTMVPEGTEEGKGEFDAITGATRTSDFILALVNKAPGEAASIVQGGK
jgi:Na+-transporting NADH:ubiquinone oxidoreductase subunit C